MLYVVCAYCRVSTSSKDQDNSFENQKSYFDREISKDKNCILYKVYADKGITGTSLNKREEFTKMLIDAGLDPIIISKDRTLYQANKDRKPLFTKIYVKNTSRFARNVMVIEILRELLKKDVHVHFLDINLIFDGSEKEFMLNLFLNFDQQDSIDKSKKVKFGHKESAEQGKIFTNGKLYGFECDFVENKLIIIEEEAKIIRFIFELYLGNYGTRRIINKLNENKYYTREGKSFSPSTIKTILRNEKYAGTLVRNKYDSGSVLQKKSYPIIKPEDEWLVFANKIPAIISVETFEAAKTKRLNKPSHKNQKGIYKGHSEFAQKIICGKCGNTYTRNIDSGRVFFNCSLKKTKGVLSCDNPNIKEELLEMAISDIMNFGLNITILNRRNEHIQELNELKYAYLNRIDQPKLKEIEFSKNELKEIYEEDERLLNLYLKGKLTEDKYDKTKMDIESRIQELDIRIQELSYSNTDVLNKIKEIEDNIKRLNGIVIKKIYTREEVLDEIKFFKINQQHPLIDTEFRSLELIERFKL